MAALRVRSGLVISLAAAAGAFGAVAILCAATAPTARADELSDLITAVDDDFANGQAAFATATSDFGSGQFAPGLAAFFDGVNDDSLNTTFSIVWGSVAVQSGDIINYGWPTEDLTVPADYADGLSTAQADFTQGVNLLNEAVTYFNYGTTDMYNAIADYTTGTEFGLSGLESVSVLPLEELLLGAAASF
jgi:hypothetical protein